MPNNDTRDLAIAHREALCRANLEFFRTTLPDIFERIVAHPSSLSLGLDENQQLLVSTKDLPSTPAITFRWWLHPIYRAFCKLETRQQFLALSHLPTLNDDGSYTDVQTQEAYHSPINPAFRERFARQHSAHYEKDYPLATDPILGEDSLPVVVVLGISSGWHIARLVEDFRIRHLVLVEPDMDMMTLSLYMLDWREVFQSIRMSGRFFSIILESNPDDVGQSVADEIRAKWPIFFTNGLSIISASHNTELSTKVQAALRKSFRIFLQGWGFFDDEILSLRHATTNLKNNYPVCQRLGVLKDKTPAIVVGSGPSLDRLLPILKELREHVIIFSCGTAIVPLARAGIRPDFHIEIERSVTTPDLLEESTSPEFMRDIPIIFPASMHPKLPTLTNTPLMIGKLVDCGSMIYRTPGRFEHVFNTNPTVTNCALEFAALMGASEIYLFGVDLGFIDQTRHHATSTNYHDTETATKTIEKTRKITDEMIEDAFEVPGNFRDTVLTYDVFNMAREEMEYFIRQRYTGRNIYNCNDGAFIAGTIALKPEDIPTSAIITGPKKNKSVSDIIAAFAPADLANDLGEHIAKLKSEVKRYANDIRDILAGEIPSREALWDTMGALYLVVAPHIKTSSAALLLHGSLLHMLCQCYQVAVTDPDDAHMLPFARKLLDNIADFLSEAQNVIDKEIAPG